MSQEEIQSLTIEKTILEIELKAMSNKNIELQNRIDALEVIIRNAQNAETPVDLTPVKLLDSSGMPFCKKKGWKSRFLSLVFGDDT